MRGSIVTMHRHCHTNAGQRKPCSRRAKFSLVRCTSVVLFFILFCVPVSWCAENEEEASSNNAKPVCDGDCKKHRELEHEKKKNVLFLMADQMSFRVMGLTGNHIVKTPNIDKLGLSGVVFRNAYTQNPVCVPSRASLVTGMKPSKVGVFFNKNHDRDTLRDFPLTMPRSFRNHGYNVEWFGKEHWGSDNKGVGFGRGNEEFPLVRQRNRQSKLSRRNGNWPQDATTFEADMNPTIDAAIADLAINFLKRHGSTKPFFLGVSLYMPHFPLLVEEKYYELYKDVMKLPRVTQVMDDNIPIVLRDRRAQNYPNLTPDQTLKARAVYFGMVSHVDDLVGRVIEALEDQGLRNDTIIVFTSDHGDLIGEHGLWYKNSFLEGSAKVPLMISHPPEIPPRTENWGPVQLMDLFPTLSEMCGVPIPFDKVDGKSLMPIVQGRENGWARHASVESYDKEIAGRMVRYKKWKYSWYEDGNGVGRYLYNVKDDPAEEFNLYNVTEYSDLITELHKLSMEDFVPLKNRLRMLSEKDAEEDWMW